MKSFCWWRLTLASCGVKPNLVQHMTLTCRSPQGEAKFHWIRSIGRSHGIWVTTFSTHLPLHIYQHSKPKCRNDSTKSSFQVCWDKSWFTWSVTWNSQADMAPPDSIANRNLSFRMSQCVVTYPHTILDLDESIRTFIHVCGAKI